MLWMEEKGLAVAESPPEPSREPGSVLRKLKQHEAAERELLAARGHLEGLRQVGALGSGYRAYSSSNAQPSRAAGFHGTYSLKEASASVTME